MTSQITNLAWLEEFYTGLCDGDWEHTYGIDISNLDNPGWSFEVDLKGTFLEGLLVEKKTIERTDNDWIFYTIEDLKFVARGGPKNLGEIISIFRAFTEDFE